MKKIIIFVIAAMMLLAVVGLTGCKDNGGQTNNDTTTTTTQVGVTAAPPTGSTMYEFKRYGYHIYHPQGFEVLNDEGNMIEFMNETGVDFTVLVLENNYDSLTELLNSEVEEDDEIVKQGSNYFLVYSTGNGRTDYTYYYYGEDIVRCELSYPDSQKDAMKGLENQIMVEVHNHSH